MHFIRVRVRCILLHKAIQPPSFTGVTRHPITDTSEAWALLERGRASRSVAPTASHAHSSRSHALLTLDVTQPAAHTRSALTLVDLAGRYGRGWRV